MKTEVSVILYITKTEDSDGKNSRKMKRTVRVETMPFAIVFDLMIFLKLWNKVEKIEKNEHYNSEHSR